MLTELAASAWHAGMLGDEDRVGARREGDYTGDLGRLARRADRNDRRGVDDHQPGSPLSL